MKLVLARYSVQFNCLAFGISEHMPEIITIPESLEVGADRIAVPGPANLVRVRFRIELIDKFFMQLLNRRGEPNGLDGSVYENSGSIYLNEVDQNNNVMLFGCRILDAELEPGIGYRDYPDGRSLVVSFRVRTAFPERMIIAD